MSGPATPPEPRRMLPPEDAAGAPDAPQRAHPETAETATTPETSGTAELSMPPGAASSEPAAAPPEKARLSRPHPLSPLVRGWGLLLAGAIIVGREFANTGEIPSIELILAIAGGLILIGGIASVASWWFTKYVIDDTEVRIETGWLSRTSRKIPFERIQSVDLTQPLIARLLGLAEVSIDAGSKDSTRLRYLGKAQAHRVRDFLVARALGNRDASVGDFGEADPAAYSSTAIRADETPIIRVAPGQLVLGAVLSTDFLISMLIIVAIPLASLINPALLLALPAMFGAVIGVIRTVGTRVLSQWHYQLLGSPGGLRITRGLTSLTSQSVPLDRIQGVRIKQPWLWRFLDRYQIDIEVLGGHKSEEDGQRSGMLLPIGTRAETLIALRAVLPDLNLADIELRPSPKRARWRHPLSAGNLAWGWNDRHVITESGWMDLRTEVAPIAKHQSVRMVQDPRTRLLRLATVRFDSTPGPVDQSARCLDPGDALALVLAHPAKAARARAAS